MKLFLASSLDKTVSQLARCVDKPVPELKILFVANAADPYTGDTWWVEADRKVLAQIGQLTEIDLRESSPEKFERALADNDIVHVCGGSVLYFMNLLRQKGLVEILTEFVRNDKIIYTGTSAGSIIISQHLDLFALDTEEAEFAKGMTDLSGLGLVDFLIVPHCNNPAHSESHSLMAKHLAEHSSPLIFLYDNQAIWIDGEKLEIIS